MKNYIVFVTYEVPKAFLLGWLNSWAKIEILY